MDAAEGSGGVSPEVTRIVVEELEACREKVIERIAKARKLTDSEVYHAGVALNAVVEKAQAYMAEVNERMASTAESEDGVGDTLDSIQRIAASQEDEVSKALENLAGISKAGRQIQELSGASRLLALNARVESARFGGEGGRAFNVIADEMRELSVAVETTNTMVSKLAAQLQDSLPKVQEQTRAMSGSIADLVEEMKARTARLRSVVKDSIESGNQALEGVLSSAREGLSHLQFQDLMIQDLEGIERLLTKTHGAVEGQLTGAQAHESKPSTFLGTIGAELDEQSGEEPSIEAGEVLLF